MHAPSSTFHPPRRVAWLIGTGVALVLAAASSPGAEARDGAPQATASTQAAFPVTLRHQFGTTTIRKAPKRVIALTDDDFVVGLGVTPIAIPRNPFSSTGMAPWLEDALGKRRPELLDVQSGYPFERIAALKPDLIIGAVTDANYQILSKIAPTLEYVRGPNEDTWQERTRFLGRALGRTNVANASVRSVSAAIEKTRKRFSRRLANRRFSLSLNYAPGVVSTLRSTDEAGVRLLSGLGLKLSPRVQSLRDSGGGRADVSVERIDLLDSDVVIMAHVSKSLRRELEANPLFKRLPAVSDRRYVALDVPKLLALSRPSILNIDSTLNRVVPAVAIALGRR